MSVTAGSVLRDLEVRLLESRRKLDALGMVGAAGGVGVALAYVWEMQRAQEQAL